MRVELLEAALRVVARQGVRAITHRAVAVESGTSLGTTTYYFATRDALLAAAFEHAVDQRLDALDVVLARSAARVSAEPHRARSALVALVADEVSAPAGVLTDLDLACEGARHPDLAPLHARLGRGYERGLSTLLEAAGSPRPGQHARLLLAYLRGLVAEEVTRPRPTSRRTVQTLTRSFLDALIAA